MQLLSPRLSPRLRQAGHRQIRVRPACPPLDVATLDVGRFSPMFPLYTATFPSSASDLERLLNESLQRIFVSTSPIPSRSVSIPIPISKRSPFHSMAPGSARIRRSPSSISGETSPALEIDRFTSERFAALARSGCARSFALRARSSARPGQRFQRPDRAFPRPRDRGKHRNLRDAGRPRSAHHQARPGPGEQAGHHDRRRPTDAAAGEPAFACGGNAVARPKTISQRIAPRNRATRSRRSTQPEDLRLELHRRRRNRDSGLRHPQAVPARKSTAGSFR